MCHPTASEEWTHWQAVPCHWYLPKHHHFEVRIKLTTAAMSIRNEGNFRSGEAFRGWAKFCVSGVWKEDKWALSKISRISILALLDSAGSGLPNFFLLQKVVKTVFLESGKLCEQQRLKEMDLDVVSNIINQLEKDMWEVTRPPERVWCCIVLDQMGCWSYQKQIAHVLRDKLLYLFSGLSEPLGLYGLFTWTKKAKSHDWVQPIIHYGLDYVIATHLFWGFERADRKLPPLRGWQYLTVVRKIGCRWIWAQKMPFVVSRCIHTGE